PAKVDMSAELLALARGNTNVTSGTDDLRPVVSRVFFQLSISDLSFVATDAHKLVKYKRTDISSNKAASFIMPKKPLNLLKNILANIDDKVNVEFNETNARFAFADTELVCRLIDGKYPNYDAVIPKENPNKLIIDRNAFLSSIKRVSIFSSRTTFQIRLKITGSELNISAEDLDFANEANERLTCQYEGE